MNAKLAEARTLLVQGMTPPPPKKIKKISKTNLLRQLFVRLRGHHWEFLPDHHSLTNCCLVEAIETTAAASGAAGAPSQLGARPKGSDYSNISID